jgi:hypothetical protein
MPGGKKHLHLVLLLRAVAVVQAEAYMLLAKVMVQQCFS